MLKGFIDSVWMRDNGAPIQFSLTIFHHDDEDELV
jgi:hypothetical protein